MLKDTEFKHEVSYCKNCFDTRVSYGLVETKNREPRYGWQLSLPANDLDSGDSSVQSIDILYCPFCGYKLLDIKFLEKLIKCLTIPQT